VEPKGKGLAVLLGDLLCRGIFNVDDLKLGSSGPTHSGSSCRRWSSASCRSSRPPLTPAWSSTCTTCSAALRLSAMRCMHSRGAAAVEDKRLLNVGSERDLREAIKLVDEHAAAI